jgi:hypothetical protein
LIPPGSRIQGVKKAPDPGSGSATLVVVGVTIVLLSLQVKYIDRIQIGKFEIDTWYFRNGQRSYDFCGKQVLYAF